MGDYIHPPELVEQSGRIIELKDTFQDTLSQLEEDEKMCAVARRHHGLAALIVVNEGDYYAVYEDQRSLVGIYAVPKSICKI